MGWTYCEYGIVHSRCRCTDGYANAQEIVCDRPLEHVYINDSRVVFPKASKAHLKVDYLGLPDPHKVEYSGPPVKPVAEQLEMILKRLQEGRIDLAKELLKRMIDAEGSRNL